MVNVPSNFYIKGREGGGEAGEKKKYCVLIHLEIFQVLMCPPFFLSFSSDNKAKFVRACVGNGGVRN